MNNFWKQESGSSWMSISDDEEDDLGAIPASAGGAKPKKARKNSFFTHSGRDKDEFFAEAVDEAPKKEKQATKGKKASKSGKSKKSKK
jgi:hypothetical protein